jgi:hypothetical protein
MKNNIDPSVEFPKVEKMLYNLAWKFARKYPYPNEEEMFEQCKSEAYFAFMRACEQYQSGRGAKFITWCYKRTWYDLKTFVTNRSKCPLEFVEIHEDLLGGKETITETYMDLIDDIGWDAREIVKLVKETPAEMMDWQWGGRPVTPRDLLQKIKDFLIAKRGMDEREVDLACRELRGCFRAPL